MLTKAFNCPKCNKPFDCTEGGDRRPVVWPAGILCLVCILPDAGWRHRGLIEFLGQPAFKKTEVGYEYTLPINEPVCAKCDGSIKILEGNSAVPADCGHYLCQGCEPTSDTFPCIKCKAPRISRKDFPVDNVLAGFARMVKDDEIEQLKESLATCKEEVEGCKARLDTLEEEKALKTAANRNCADCGIERPVERLFKCNDCKSINCGNCFFDSHHGHDVVKLLGVELDFLEKANGTRYTETIQGLHGNLQYVQKNVNEAVEKVLAAGKDCLAEISKRAKYDEALEIATAVEKAAEEFEKHCEEYIPVGRKLATRLTELSERLVQEKKN